ncbi:MAG: NrfD/PsrC family molybdoenzyme membrane anchor subunit [Actinomycetota bacterium]
MSSTNEGKGYYGRPVLKKPVWIWAVPAYFVVGGAGAAAATLGAATRAAGGDEVECLVRKCRWIALTGLGVGSALLVYDLGRPSRFLNMLRVFRPSSPLNVGSWLLATATPAAGFSAISSGALGDAAAVSAGVLALPITGYPGVLLANTAVPVWQEMGAALPGAFVASAATSAASLLELTDLSDKDAAIVRRFAVLAKVGESITGMVAERKARSVPEVGRALDSERPKVLLKIARTSAVAGAAASLLSKRSPKVRRLAGALGTIGAAAFKFGIFFAGDPSAMDPEATFAQQRAGHGARAVGS